MAVTNLRTWGAWAALAVCAAVLMALLDPGGGPQGGLPAYLALASTGTGLLALAWRHVSGQWPIQAMDRRLMAAVLVALLLRLGLGAFLYHSLPTLGYQERHHQAGFFFPDGFQREDDARQLVASNRPLTWDRLARPSSDQYGGLLALTVLVYKGLAPLDPRPLLMVVVSTFVSVAGVIYTWGFGRRAFGPTVAVVAAWLFALYPEGVLLAATSMREPYIATGLAMVLFGFVCLRQGEEVSGWTGLAIGVLLALLVSPPFALLMAASAGLGWILIGAGHRSARWAALLVLLVGVAIGSGLAIRSWSTLPDAPEAPLEVAMWRMTEAASYQMARLRTASGWVQEILARTPSWAHTPLIVFYGISQPLLPAAIADNTSVPLMHATAVLRSLGWFLLLTVLIYGIGAALLSRHVDKRSEVILYSVLVVAIVLLASYVGGGDQWDNPRYRSTFLVLEAGLASWAIVRARREGMRGLGRVFWIIGLVNLCLLTWYLGRYLGTPILGLYPTLALTAVLVLLSLAGMFLRDLWKARRAS